MRKLFAIGFLAVVAVLGLSVSAKASTTGYNPSATSYCNFSHSDPQCKQTPPGAPGFCGPTSSGYHGTCTPDTLRLTTIDRRCHCQVVKIWHDKIVCGKEVWYYTLKVICPDSRQVA